VRKFSDSVDHGWRKPTSTLDPKTSVEQARESFVACAA
jgi:hypothetical protein